MGSFSAPARRVAGVLLAAAMIPPGYWSMRLSRADQLDRQGWPDAVRRASDLAPGRADLRARFGDWRGAVARNPYDAASWIRIGLEAEAGGDQVAAERSLRRAAEIDRLFEPRWTLANYYFRRGEFDSFWIWARRAAEMSGETPIALYRLCREVTPDFGVVFDRLVAGQPQLAAGFLDWVRAEGGVADLRAAAGRALESAGPDQSRALVECSSRLLIKGATADALHIWNRLIDRGLLAFGRLEPANGASLSNGDFRRPPAGETFNWALPVVPGVAVRHGEGGLRYEFSGSQPERCELLAQYVPVLGGRRYRLSSRYRTAGFARGAGPRWQVPPLSHGPPLAAEEWAEASLEFETPPEAAVIRLALVYQRAPGTTRITGLLWLENVRLEMLEARSTTTS